MSNAAFSFHRRKRLECILGVGRSTIYNMVRSGLLTSPVSLGARSVGWPSYEIDAILSARVIGKSDDEIKVLVSELEAARKLAA